MLLIKKDAILRLFLCLLYFLTSTPSLADDIDTACADAQGNRQYDEIARVRYIHDGDTLHLSDGRKIRLIGINTPELARDNRPEEAYASEAKKALNTLFKNDKSIGLVFGKDRKDHYGRVLAHVFSANRQNVQAYLLKHGYASAIVFPPNTQFAACYLALEHQARCNKRGLWKDNTIINANALNKLHAGFQLIRGNVISVKMDTKGIWLNLDNKITVGIRPDDRTLFDEKKINTMINQSIMIRGWLNKSNKTRPFYMRIRHPLSIQLAADDSCN